MTISKGGTPTPSTTTSPGAAGLSPGESSTVQNFMQQFQAAQGAGTGKVWMPGVGGQGPLPPGAPPSARQFAGGWMSADDAEGAYLNWSQKTRDDFRAKGLLSGLLTAGAGDLEAYSLWQSLVKQSSLYGAQGKAVSPMDILSGYVKANSSGGWIKQGDFEINPVTGEKRYIGPRFKTTTQVNANLSDPATARAIATQLFQQLLGRDPGQGEIAAYAQALAQSEAQNPSTTTTTTQYDSTTGDPTGSSSVTTGGMTDQGRALLASDEIKKKAEYGATQAATTYMQALQQAVGSG
ncbi:MAG: hypothetical protein ACTHON_15060 [Humibacter sp.]